MDLGTASSNDQSNQVTARGLLHSFCENGFEGSINACALALGRDAGELGNMLHEGAVIDDDLVMKLRGIAQERGIDLDSH
jgi:hypothetical protein